MIREIQGELLRFQFDLTAVLLWLVSAPFYALGWLVGFIMRCLLWMVAAMVAGYRSGRG